jgi:phosphate/sulfate permease
LRKFIVGHDCYAGFSVGTNNVANVVAALAGLGLAYDIRAFIVFSLLFGVGAFFFGEKILKSVSRDIIPVGEFSASVVSILTATFVLIASCLGLPAPYVQFTTFSVLGVSCVKDGYRNTFGKAIVQTIFWVWFAVPVFACGLSFVLHHIFVK